MKKQRNWRIALIALIIVAFIGPWGFDRVHVPAEYECSSPIVRLEGDFCGVPLSGIQLFLWVGSAFISISVGVLNGKFLFSDRIHELLISSLLLLPLLPIFSTLLLILRGDLLRRQVLAIIAWALALSGGLYLGLNNHPAFWKAWGLCLYTGLAIIALSMEGIRFQRMRLKDPG